MQFAEGKDKERRGKDTSSQQKVLGAHASVQFAEA